MVAIVERPWALDVPPPVEVSVTIEDQILEEPVACHDPDALARGILVGLAVSAPLWLGIAWMAARFAGALFVG